MRWNVEQVGIDRSDALERFAEQRIVRPLSRMGERIRYVWVRLKSGDGKAHQGTQGAAVEVALYGGQVLHLDAWAGCHYGAVDEVADRTRRSVRRKLERRETRRRRAQR